MHRLLHASKFHGNDGLGDVRDEIHRELGAENFNANNKPASTESAANALVRLAKEYEGELELLSLGPLTNVALATRLDPLFLASSNRTPRWVAHRKRGNVTPVGEFNFYADPRGSSGRFGHVAQTHLS